MSNYTITDDDRVREVVSASSEAHEAEGQHNSRKTDQMEEFDNPAPIRKAGGGLVNKRIDFDKETLDAIATITPCFEFDGNLSQNEVIGAVIKESVMLAKSACKVDEEVLSLLVGISDLSKALKCEDEARDKTAKALRSILKEIVG